MDDAGFHNLVLGLRGDLEDPQDFHKPTYINGRDGMKHRICQTVSGDPVSRVNIEVSDKANVQGVAGAEVGFRLARSNDATHQLFGG